MHGRSNRSTAALSVRRGTLGASRDSAGKPFAGALNLLRRYRRLGLPRRFSGKIPDSCLGTKVQGGVNGYLSPAFWWPCWCTAE